MNINPKEQKLTLKNSRAMRAILYTAIIAVGIILDQLTKWLSTVYLTKVTTVPLIEGVLHLTYVENRGAAFGMLADNRWVFIIVSSITIIGLGIYLYLDKNKNLLSTVAISMIVSGGIGNMIDRIAVGFVVDFIDFRLINFAVFNGADSFVCVGAGILILSLILEIIEESKNAKAKGQKK